MATRDERIANMQRPTARVNQILEVINQTEADYKAAYDNLPREAKEALDNFINIGGKPTGNQWSLYDFYDYDYEDEMLPSMNRVLFNRIEDIRRSLDFLEEYKNEAIHNGELDTEDEDDKHTIRQLDRAIGSYEDVLNSTSKSHGMFVAMSKASDSPDRYDNFDEVMDIVSEYGA